MIHSNAHFPVKNVVNLSENESCLLKLLLIKTNSKREVMYEIWEKGIIVTESSYYKLVRQLRQSFKKSISMKI